MRRVVAIAVLAAGCGAPRESVRARYPESRFVTGEGAGRDATAAEAEARAAVARQVRSRLESTLTVQNASVDGRSSERADSVTRERTAFAHAELIRIVPDETRCSGGECRAFAALERAEAAAALRRDYDAARPRFLAAADEAGGEAARPAAFTVHLREAEAAYVPLADAGRQIEAVSGPSAAFTADHARLAALRDQAAKMVAGVHVALRLDAVPPDLRDGLGRALAAAFADAGLPAAPADVCAGLELRPEATVTCALGSLGPSCDLALRGALHDCTANADLGAIEARVTGVSPRSDADARAALLRRLDEGALEAPIHHELAQLLPVP